MIVVLGGGGFLGRHLRELLLSAGQTFAIVSPRQPPGHGPQSPGESFMFAEAFAGPEGDDLLRRAEVIVNLASRSVPGTFSSEPWKEITEKVAPAATLYGRCSTLNPRLRIVQISSGGTVYGRIEADKACESQPCAPISGYGLANAMMEDALRFMGRTAGTPYRILRVSNPAGHFQTSDAQGIVSIAVRAAASGAKFRLFGDGSQIRDYLDADDVADAILAACKDERHEGATWNVGSGVGRSVLEIVALVERVTGRSIGLDRHPARSIDVPKIVLDCSQIERDLGWRAHRGLDQAVQSIWTSHGQGLDDQRPRGAVRTA